MYPAVLDKADSISAIDELSSGSSFQVLRQAACAELVATSSNTAVLYSKLKCGLHHFQKTYTHILLGLFVVGFHISSDSCIDDAGKDSFVSSHLRDAFIFLLHSSSSWLTELLRNQPGV